MKLHLLLPKPTRLGPGWVMKLSTQTPNCFYYYNIETGESTFAHPPLVVDDIPAAVLGEDETPPLTVSSSSTSSEEPESKKPRLEPAIVPSSSSTASASSTLTKKEKETKRVRCLHILKKHATVRRPSSWRCEKITITKTEAKVELKALHSMLEEVKNSGTSFEEIKETFESIAQGESDCSSAKRGGDLGYFEKGKMQKEFEVAAFMLQKEEMSGIVESSSGYHIILRIG